MSPCTVYLDQDEDEILLPKIRCSKVEFRARGNSHDLRLRLRQLFYTFLKIARKLRLKHISLAMARLSGYDEHIGMARDATKTYTQLLDFHDGLSSNTKPLGTTVPTPSVRTLFATPSLQEVVFS